MSKTRFFFSLFIIVLLVLQSCFIEKRRYTSGFYVRHGNSAAKKNASSVTCESTVSLREVKRDLEAGEIVKNEAKKKLLAKVNTGANALPSPQIFRANFKIAKDSCDTLVLNNGTEILTKILEIGPQVLRYKHCDNPNGPVYVVDASEVRMIIFSNGSVEEFKATQTPVSSAVISEYNPYIVSPYKMEKTSKNALTFGLLSIPLLIIYFAGVVFAILAIKNGMDALRWYNREPRSFDPRTKTRAQTGIFLGSVALAILILGIAALVLLGAGII